jgi:carbamoyltransferase
MYILGISAYYHDSAACLIKDGDIICASHEERFTRVKNDSSFPLQSILFCLDYAKIDLSKVKYITFYDKPFLKFERIIETYLSYAPLGLKSFLLSMPIWIKEKLLTKRNIKKQLSKLSHISMSSLPPLLFTEHHQAHAASAYFASPFNEASVLCIDGVGEWATTSLWQAEENSLTAKWQINFPHSLGLLYSAFTYYCGFKVNSGEYKLMGLAPYGKPTYKKIIYDNLIDVKEDGSYRLDMTFFNYTHGLTMTSEKFHQLFNAPPRVKESEMTEFYMNMAKSIQEVIEEIILKIVENVHQDFGGLNLCLAGGVALNCVSNGNLLRKGPFKNIWVQPAAGDAGGSLGAALATWHEYLDKPKNTNNKDNMSGAFLGIEFSNDEIQVFLKEKNIKYTTVTHENLFSRISTFLENSKVIGIFQGRTEFGPRALGSRSIIADPRNPEMQSILNMKIKKRESFRPFAPAILSEDTEHYFDFDSNSSYMQFVSKVKNLETKLPSITHVDNSARLQTITEGENPFFYSLIKEFKKNTGCPVIINTSFNVRGEPIVNSPTDALNCFLKTEMDVLILENNIIVKDEM